MTKDKDRKRKVRERMRKTGESYTTARTQLLKKAPPGRAPTEDYADIAGMSDAAVLAKTGKNWKAWVAALDRVEAAKLPHKEIARYLQHELGVAAWWAQTVTVAYERIRGLRDKGQRRGGGYDVNKSKTVPVPIATLYAAFGARKRRAWLGEHPWKVRKAMVEKSMRVTFGDGSPLDVYFWRKGPGKSQVQLQHRGFPTKAEADEARAFWTEKLTALAALLRP